MGTGSRDGGNVQGLNEKIPWLGGEGMSHVTTRRSGLWKIRVEARRALTCDDQTVGSVTRA